MLGNVIRPDNYLNPLGGIIGQLSEQNAPQGSSKAMKYSNSQDAPSEVID